MNETKEVKVVTADPTAIGLFGLAVVTLVASSQKLGWTEGLSLVIPWALFLGGIAQFYASILDAKLNNTFGATAFAAYGLFWMGVSLSWLMNLGVFGSILQENADMHQLGFAFIGYLIFTLFLTIGSLETNKVLFSIFCLIDLLFIGLSLSSLGIMEHAMHQLAAYSELLISLLSFYGAGAAVLNKHFGRVFLPVGKPFGLIRKGTALKTQTKKSIK